MPRYLHEQAEDTYVSQRFIDTVSEYFDYTDETTRKTILSVNEADQNSVLLNLTMKLYDHINDKIDDVDFGDIPRSKGDITKLTNWESMQECHDIILDILKEYKQPTTPIDIIGEAMANMQSRKDVFMKAYMMNYEFPIVIYNTITLAIVDSISYMIAACIEFIKDPANDTFQITLDRMALTKTSQHLLFENLKKFNDSCKNGDMDKALEFMMKNTSKNFLGGPMVVGGAILAIGALLNIVPIIRELIYFYYFSRVRTSDYFAIQADLLQMNAYNLEHNRIGMDAEKRKSIAKRQMKIVELFRGISNKIAVDCKSAENSATKEIISDGRKKYKIDDVMDAAPDSASSSLF